MVRDALLISLKVAFKNQKVRTAAGPDMPKFQVIVVRERMAYVCRGMTICIYELVGVMRRAESCAVTITCMFSACFARPK